MATTIVGICNIALGRLGATFIADIDGDAPNEVKCAEAYPTALDEVLADHPWSFALTRQQLAESADENLTPYEYRYQLPVDPPFLGQPKLVDEDYQVSTVDFLVEGSSLYTNLEPAILRYVTRVEDPTYFPPRFCLALAYRIAALLAYALFQSESMQKDMENLYVYELGVAKAADVKSARQEPQPRAFWRS